MKLTDSQKKAIEHGGRNLQLIACAGSGKTEVVARRVVHLLTPGIRDVFWMATPAMDEVLYVSPAFESIWERSLDSLRQRPQSFYDAIYIEDRERAVGIIKGQRDQGFHIEYRIVRQDGSVRWIHDRGFPVKDASGNVCRIAGVAEDITERKLAEVALKQADDHLRLVLDTTPGLIYTSRPDGYLDYFNRRWLEYAGLSLEEAQGWAWTAAIHPEDVERIVNAWRASLASGEPFQDESRVRRADGEYRWMLHRTVPLRDEHGSIVNWYGLSTDIDDRKAMEDALREAASQLEGLSRRLVELQESERKELARELHDRIGQSLTALNINLKLLATALPAQVGDELRARLADSEALVESTAAAIRNVMSELRPPMLDDQGLVPALEWYAKQFSARTAISVAVRGLESAERPAPEMEIALFRVAQEALNNVVKHARASRVEINLGRSGSEYVMTVEDDGVGFDATEDSAARQAGLGMVTMRERTQALGGRLEVRAGRGDGTRLTVRVPA